MSEAASPTPEEIRQLLAILEESGWDEVQLTVGDVSLSLSRNGRQASSSLPPAAAVVPPQSGGPDRGDSPAAADVAASREVAPAAPERAPAAPPPSDAAHVVKAPSVGVFWRAPEPGAPPFVEVGDAVEAGQQVGIVEVMKLMNQVVSDVAGMVTAIHVGDGEAVEFDSPLVSVEPSGG